MRLSLEDPIDRLEKLIAGEYPVLGSLVPGHRHERCRPLFARWVTSSADWRPIGALATIAARPRDQNFVNRGALAVLARFLVFAHTNPFIVWIPWKLDSNPPSCLTLRRPPSQARFARRGQDVVTFASNGENALGFERSVSRARARVHFLTMGKGPEAQIETGFASHRVSHIENLAVLFGIVDTLPADHVANGPVFAAIYDAKDAVAACSHECPHLRGVADDDDGIGENERALSYRVAVALGFEDLGQIDCRAHISFFD